METASKSFSSFSVPLTFEQIPRTVAEKAGLCFVDFLGVAMGGSGSKEASIVRDALLRGGGGCSTVIGSDSKSDCLPAAFCNSVAGHALEFDDTHLGAIIHAGASVIPAALAVSEMVEASGTDLITSIVVGYDVAIRASLPIILSHRTRGFHATGTCGVFGAAVAAGKLLKLDEEQMTSAIGLAGNQAAGLTEFLTTGDMSKRLNPARAAYDGVLSALMASKGFTGPESVFEGGNGFWRAYSDRVEPEKATAGLGSSFAIEDVGFKPYACCRYFHTCIEGALKLKQTSGFSASDIKSITVRTFKLAAEKNGNATNVVSAQFSLPYSVAVALIDGRATFREFSEERIARGDVQSLAARVTTVLDPQFHSRFPEKWISTMRIGLKDGREVEATIDSPKGEPASPMTDGEAKQKFLGLAANFCQDGRAEAIYSAASRLRELGRIDELTRLLR